MAAAFFRKGECAIDSLQLATERLLLRPLALPDARTVSELAGDREIADRALYIPHPLSVADAEAWIVDTIAQAVLGTAHVFAIREKAGGAMVGTMGLDHLESRAAELGYWLGRPYWGRGYATEAGLAVLRFGFEQLHLERIHANHIGGNAASGRVLEKLGFQCTGTRREAALHLGQMVDLVDYEIRRCAAG